MKRLIFAVFMTGCATLDPKIAARFEAADRFESCLGVRVRWNITQSQKVRCLEESVQYCRSKGLEDGCGSNDVLTWGK